MGRTIILMGVVLTTLLHSGMAQEQARDSLTLLTKSQTGDHLIQTLGELSWEYKNIHADSALYFAKWAWHESNKIKSQKGIALASNVMANAFEALGNMDSAFYYHQESLRLNQAIGDTIKMADSYNNLGILYDMSSNFDQALNYYFKALKIYEAQGNDPFKVAMVLGNVGIVYKKMKEYKLVHDYYAKALAIYEKQNSLFGISVTKGNMASILIFLGEYEKSLKYSEEAIKGYEKLGYHRYVPYAQSNMAIALDSLKMHPGAEALYRKAINRHSSYQNLYELAMTYYTLSANLLRQRKYPSAIAMADSSLYFSQLASVVEFELGAMKVQADALIGLGDYAAATKKLKAYIAGNDSLFEQNKTKAIFELQTQYETEKKQQQISLQQAEIYQKDLIIQRDKIILLGIVLLFVMVLAIVFLLHNKAKWKQAKLLEEAKANAQREQMTAVVSSQEKERKRFAEDIHDGFGQLISVLKLNVSALGRLGTSGDALGERQKIFDASLKLINDMYAELRNICFNLMPQTLVKHGLQAALREFADRINHAGSVRTSVLVYDLDTRLTDLQEISLYRIIQEVTNNILKYANATEITIQIVKDLEELTLTIEDDGEGFDVETLKQGKGNGWKNINARANFIKAEFDFESKSGVRGTTFILNMPILAEDNEDKILSIEGESVETMNG